MGFNIENMISFTYFNTDRCEMKQIFINLAKFGNNSLQYVHNLQKKIFTNKNSVTDALEPAVISMNFTLFPHRLTLMVRIMKVFSS